jgi:hypothetical protein
MALVDNPGAVAGLILDAVGDAALRRPDIPA